jgi:hypothetical protein
LSAESKEKQVLEDWLNRRTDRQKQWLFIGVFIILFAIVGWIEDPSDHEPIVDKPITESTIRMRPPLLP